MNVYLILDLEIHDISIFSEYIRKIPEIIERHQGRYIVQGVEATVIEGDWDPARIVVIEFPSRDNAEAFLSDADALALFDVRQKSTTSKLLLVDGCLA